MEVSTGVRLILGILVSIGSISVFMAIMNLFTPGEEKADLVDVSVRKF